MTTFKLVEQLTNVLVSDYENVCYVETLTAILYETFKKVLKEVSLIL